MMFSAPMVRAIRTDRKTQTRRIMKPQPQHSSGVVDAVSQYPLQNGVRFFMRDGLSELVSCPYGQPGDRLWVKETWFTAENLDGIKPTELLNDIRINYAADLGDGDIILGRLRPSIFMRRWMSRLTLELSAVRVERLNEISEEDAIAEGIDVFSDGAGYTVPLPDGKLGPWQRNPVDAYRNLWEIINGAGSWDANPWVWVVEFKRAGTQEGAQQR